MPLEERRKAEFPQYERPKYYGTMKPWRAVLINEWLVERAAAGRQSYLDVGCGPAETRAMWRDCDGTVWRGCEVVASVCEPGDIDLIEGAHALPYADGQFDIATCNDVFEHILEEDVPDALRELSRVTKHEILLGISRKPGPFHPTIKTQEWWLYQIERCTGRAPTVVYEDRIPPVKRPYLWVVM